MNELAEKLQKPFCEDEYEFRIQSCGKTEKGVWAKTLCYVTNRAIMNRLDEVFDPLGWQNVFDKGPDGGVVCGISVRRENGQWVTKWDGAANTDVQVGGEPDEETNIKGGLSNAMKRAAVQWGIGRHLYKLKEGFAEVSLTKQAGWYYAKTKEGEAFWWQPPSLPDWAVSDRVAPKTEPPKTKTPPKTEPPKTETKIDKDREENDKKLNNVKRKFWLLLEGAALVSNCSDMLPSKEKPERLASLVYYIMDVLGLPPDEEGYESACNKIGTIPLKETIANWQETKA